VLAKVDAAMRKLIAEIFDPTPRYEYEVPLPCDLVRAPNHLGRTEES